MDNAARAALLDVSNLDTAPLEPMPTIVDYSFLPDIGRMNGNSPSANWLLAGSLRAGQRAAAIMGLIRSAQLNGHDPYVYLKDVFTRLPTHRDDDIAALLPHRWASPTA
jgi:hypothetical protein